MQLSQAQRNALRGLAVVSAVVLGGCYIWQQSKRSTPPPTTPSPAPEQRSGLDTFVGSKSGGVFRERDVLPSTAPATAPQPETPPAPPAVLPGSKSFQITPLPPTPPPAPPQMLPGSKSGILRPPATYEPGEAPFAPLPGSKVKVPIIPPPAPRPAPATAPASPQTEAKPKVSLSTPLPAGGTTPLIRPSMIVTASIDIAPRPIAAAAPSRLRTKRSLADTRYELLRPQPASGMLFPPPWWLDLGRPGSDWEVEPAFTQRDLSLVQSWLQPELPIQRPPRWQYGSPMLPLMSNWNLQWRATTRATPPFEPLLDVSFFRPEPEPVEAAFEYRGSSDMRFVRGLSANGRSVDAVPPLLSRVRRGSQRRVEATPELFNPLPGASGPILIIKPPTTAPAHAPGRAPATRPQSAAPVQLTAEHRVAWDGSPAEPRSPTVGVEFQELEPCWWRMCGPPWVPPQAKGAYALLSRAPWAPRPYDVREERPVPSALRDGPHDLRPRWQQALTAGPTSALARRVDTDAIDGASFHVRDPPPPHADEQAELEAVRAFVISHSR
jgi:hypothetical protein